MPFETASVFLEFYLVTRDIRTLTASICHLFASTFALPYVLQVLHLFLGEEKQRSPVTSQENKIINWLID